MVYPTGGVFGEQQLLREPFEAQLESLWPAVEVRNPRFPPLVGGLIVAARTAGIEIDQSWMRRVEESLHDRYDHVLET